MNRPTPAFFGVDAPDVGALRAILDDGRGRPRPPMARELAQGVPLYDVADLESALGDERRERALMSEWHEVLSDGAGVLVLAGAWPDRAQVDRVTRWFHDVLEAERSGGGGGDHFARAGANGRVWNTAQKLCLQQPALFAHYDANPWLALVCQAWLGPGYQVTSQVNCVYPGGQAQDPHRDYHLGFFPPAESVAWPRSVHRMSPLLTLQGAVAHVDMPVASGPTLLLPHSQKLDSGYLATGRPEFAACFAERHVHLPLRQGDAMFFNPALMYAAGHNRSADIQRMANLLQVSSPFGRAMESLDRVAMSTALYPELLAELEAGRLNEADARRAVAACAEGYPFPTNLDLDPPLHGLAPATHQALMNRALAERWEVGRYRSHLLRPPRTGLRPARPPAGVKDTWGGPAPP